MEKELAIDMFIKDQHLKKCPFCGCPPVRFEDIRYPNNIDDPYYVHGIMCSNETCIMHQREKYFRTEDAANMAWNKRSSQED